MSRMKRIAAKLAAYELDAILITSGASRQYATGLHSSAGTVLVTGQGCWFFVDFRYVEAAKALADDYEVMMTTVEHTASKLAAERLPKNARVGIEEDFMTVGARNVWEKALEGRELRCAHMLTRELRAVKDEAELAAMVKAQRIAERAWADMLDGLIRVGVSEQELSAELQYRMLRYGAERMSFEPIVVSGPNSSKPHGTPGERRLQEGDFVTFDFGCVADGYCSDMTRTVAVGHAADEMQKVYDLVLRAQAAGIAKARGGVVGMEIDKAARDVIAGEGYGEYFGHGFGHGIGIEIHEPPNASPSEKNALPSGAVISAEPGIYLPGRFGVRIEDVIVLRDGGCENLMKADKTLTVV